MPISQKRSHIIHSFTCLLSALFDIEPETVSKNFLVMFGCLAQTMLSLVSCPFCLTLVIWSQPAWVHAASHAWTPKQFIYIIARSSIQCKFFRLKSADKIDRNMTATMKWCPLQFKTEFTLIQITLSIVYQTHSITCTIIYCTHLKPFMKWTRAQRSSDFDWWLHKRFWIHPMVILSEDWARILTDNEYHKIAIKTRYLVHMVGCPWCGVVCHICWQ